MIDADLDRLLVQVRRIEEHRVKGAEAEIRKTYQKLLQELRHYMADEYSRYAEDDRLTYDILQRNGYYARFLEEVEQKINDISPEVRRTIRSTVEQTYEYTYNGMIDCVQKATTGVDLGTLKGCTPEVIKRAVENPISKLTLNDRLEKHRKEIIYDIKQDISVGLMNGDRYSTMANRIKKSVEGDYKKAIRIARTETHRVREAGNHDAAVSVNDDLKNSTASVQMMKTWRTMKDERVRPAGKAKGKNRKYDHREMEGESIPIDEEFTLPSGAKTAAPGQSGIAGEDINCRCYLSYGLQKVSESDKIEISKGAEFEPAESIKEAESYAKDVLGIPNVSYKGVDITTANEWNRGLSDTFNRFPELKENFGFVGECHERNKALKPVVEQHYWGIVEKKYPQFPKDQLKPYVDKQVNSFMRKSVSVGKDTFAQSWSPITDEYQIFSGVTVNKDWGKDSVKFIEALKKNVASKWHPESCDTIRSVLDHEVGHQLDALLSISDLPEIRNLFDFRDQHKITEELSRYAWDNRNTNKYGEMIAEAWAEYCNNPSPREIAKTVGERIISEYDEYEKLIEEAKRMGMR